MSFTLPSLVIMMFDGLRSRNTMGRGFWTLRKRMARHIWSAHERARPSSTGLPARVSRICSSVFPDILHDDIVPVREAEVVIDLGKVRVREPGQDPRLGLELGERLALLLFGHGLAGPQLLCGKEPASLGAVGHFVHAAHAAPAEDVKDVISIFQQPSHTSHSDPELRIADCGMRIEANS